MLTPALSGISSVLPQFIDDALRAAPTYGPKVAAAMGRTIRCIHGLQHLHRTVDLNELEIYIGRSSRASLAQRWKEHAKDHRGHNYGVVLFCGDADRIVRLEEIAVRLLVELKARGMLCVGDANTYRGGPGAWPRVGENALVYMTWKIQTPAAWKKPTIGEIREVSSIVAKEMRGEIKSKQLENGLRTLKRLSDYDPLRWWTP